jgi:D-3-phosphoglycerate dehydrogenase
VAKSKEKQRARGGTGPEGDVRLGAGGAGHHGWNHVSEASPGPQALVRSSAPGQHGGFQVERSTMPKVVLGRKLPEAGMAVFAARPDVELIVLDNPDVAAWHAAIRDADGTLCWLERMDPAAVAAAPRLRVVSRIGVGYDTVDVPACTARGIAVMVANGSNDLSVAEHALMLLLAVARRAVDIDQHVKRGGWWPDGGLRMVDLAGRRALVVGYGRIGTRVARYLKAFHMEVAVLDPFYSPHRIVADGFRAARDLHTALAEADVVTLHCPLSPATHHLMDQAAFAAMKPGGILVNTARGPVVSQAALVEALQSGHLMGAGLDVLEVEPAAPGNPLLSLPNVVISPHSAASTAEGMDRMARISAQNILDVLDGRADPSMMVNPGILRANRP